MIPVRTVLTVFSVLWLLLCAAALCNWALVKRAQPLHTAISACLALRTLSTIHELAYYTKWHYYGYLTTTSTTIYCFFQVAFVYNHNHNHKTSTHLSTLNRQTGATTALLMLVAVGWCVVDDEPPRRRVEICVFSAILAAMRGLDVALGSWFSVGLGVLQLAVMCVAMLQTADTALVLAAQQRECAPEAAADDAFARFDRRNAVLCRLARAYRVLLVPYSLANVAAAVCSLLLHARWVAVLLKHSTVLLLGAALLLVFALRRDMRRTPYFSAYRDLFTKDEPLELLPPPLELVGEPVGDSGSTSSSTNSSM